MAMFVGGPYDGVELPVDPKLMPKIRLPARHRLDDFIVDPRSTDALDRPHHYKVDWFVDPPVYRFVKSD